LYLKELGIGWGMLIISMSYSK